MPKKVTWNQELNIIEIKFQQEITHQDLEESTADALKLAHGHNLTKFLIDISEADLSPHWLMSMICPISAMKKWAQIGKTVWHSFHLKQIKA